MPALAVRVPAIDRKQRIAALTLQQNTAIDRRLVTSVWPVTGAHTGLLDTLVWKIDWLISVQTAYLNRVA